MMPLYGVINVNKPEGWTSQDVVTRLKRPLGTRRVGHTGTLDPMATGVLPVCFGKATRIIEYYDADLKTYEAKLQLGKTTDTLDRTGKVLSERSFSGITVSDIEQALSAMTGWVDQIPPKYSALKVNGRRLYEYARAGEEVEIRTRRIYIDEAILLDADVRTGVVSFRVCCSKGTYIRTICDDLGRMLGPGAMMTGLVRTESGSFRIEAAHTLPELLEMTEEMLASAVLPMDETLVHLGRAELKSAASLPFYRNGRSIPAGYIHILEEPHTPEHAPTGSSVRDVYRIYDPAGGFLGTSRYNMEKGTFDPGKILGS